jgi:hypothetical protein
MSSAKRLSLWLALALCAGCGIERLGNLGHDEYPRPASAISGATSWMDPTPNQLGASDGENPLSPFLVTTSSTSYEVKLPSSKYSMIEVTARVGNAALRALVPSIGEESQVTGVDLDARAMTETLIVEARLSHDGDKLKLVTPEAYLGTRNLIRAAFDQVGPTRDLLEMVEAFFTRIDPTIGSIDPDFFTPPVYNDDWTVKSGAISSGSVARNPFDYNGDGVLDHDTVAFDAKLAEVAQLYKPAGCLDPSNLRVVFTVDFNTTAKNGNCGSIDRFKWATDKPGKTMFFVGWVHKQSVLQDKDFCDEGEECLYHPKLKQPVNTILGASTPNQIQMYDDGTNGDEVAGDNVWTVSFVIPRGDPDTGRVFRIGYKFTWGTKGAVWTGSEEWPGNSRILEVADEGPDPDPAVKGDGFVYRHESFGDEATNKDASNLSTSSKNTGTITWTTDLHGCGPEARENTYDFKTCSCDSAIATPKGIGPIKVACTQ